MPELSAISTFLGSSGAIGAVLGVASLAAAWLRDHDAAENYRKDIASLGSRATFWKTWLEGQVIAGASEEEMTEARKMAEAELRDLSNSMRRMVNMKAASRPTPNRINPARRLLLLYLPP